MDENGNPKPRKLSSAETEVQIGANLGISGSREKGQDLIAVVNGRKYVNQSNTLNITGMVARMWELAGLLVDEMA